MPKQEPDLLKLSTGWMAKPCTGGGVGHEEPPSRWRPFWADWRTTHQTTFSLMADQTVPLRVTQRTTRPIFGRVTFLQ